MTITEARLHPLATWQRAGNSVELKTPETKFQLDIAAEQLLARYCEWSVVADDEHEDVTELNSAGIMLRRAQWTAPVETMNRIKEFLDASGYVLSGVGLQEMPATPLGTRPETGQFTFTGTATETSGREVGGTGVDADPTLAKLKMLVEIYERVSCDVRFNPDLGGDADFMPISGELVSYEGWQLDNPDFPFTSSASGSWATVLSPDGQDLASVPLELACYPDRLHGNRCGSATSSGVAAHPELPQAQISSIYELIERDSFMVHWFGSVPRSQILTPPNLMSRCSLLEDLGFKVNFVDLSLDIAPVVMVVLFRTRGGAPHLAIGLAASSEVEDACDKALSEAETWVMSATKASPTTEQVRMRDIRKPKEHLLWYDNPERHTPILQLIDEASITVDQVPSGPKNVPDMQKKLADAGYRWFTVELNKDNVTRTGVHVVRSIVPGLVPIQFGYAREPLGMHRLTRGSDDTKHGPGRTKPRSYLTHPLA